MSSEEGAWVGRITGGEVQLFKEKPTGSNFDQWWKPQNLGGWYYQEGFGGSVASAVDCCEMMRERNAEYTKRLVVVRDGWVVWAEQSSKGDGAFVQNPWHVTDAIPLDIHYGENIVPAAPPVMEVASPAPAEMNITPTEAAKQIRVIAKQLREAAGGENSSENLTLTLYWMKDALKSLNALEIRLNQVQELLPELEQMINERRAAPARERLNWVRSRLVSLGLERQNVFSRLKRANEYGNKLEGMNGQQELLDDLHRYAQAIPTYEGALLTPAENILHAIYVVLKNNDYIEGVKGG